MPRGDVAVSVWSWNIIINVAASFHVMKQKQELPLEQAVMHEWAWCRTPTHHLLFPVYFQFLLLFS